MNGWMGGLVKRGGPGGVVFVCVFAARWESVRVGRKEERKEGSKELERKVR